MDISMEYYKVFYYVTECGSITLAAEKLCISQPAVSQAISNMEKECKCKLFIRTRKGVVLTPEGKLLSNYVKKGYEYIKQGEYKLKKMLDVDSGEVRIGASDMTLQFYLLPYLEKFHSTFPNIKVKVTNVPTPETLKYLSEGKIDFGVVSTPFEIRENIKVTKVKKIQDIFIAGPQFNFLKTKKLQYSELTDLPLICLEKNTSTRKFMDMFLMENNIVVEPEFELATSDMIVQFTRRNLGIGCVVSEFAKRYIEQEELFKVEFEPELPDREICVITDKYNPVSVAGSKMLEIIM